MPTSKKTGKVISLNEKSRTFLCLEMLRKLKQASIGWWMWLKQQNAHTPAHALLCTCEKLFIVNLKKREKLYIYARGIKPTTLQLQNLCTSE